jgi:hypothetical protein
MGERAKKLQQVNPDPLSETFSNFLASVSRGSIRIDIDNQPILKLTINQADINSIKLELGQKFTEMLLDAGIKTISDKIRDVT